MYNIYFDNRLISIRSKNEQSSLENMQVFCCKNKKSFDKAYNLFINNSENINMAVFSSAPKRLFKHLKSKFKIVKAAGGVVLNSEDKLLIIKRNGFWDLPKGKIEKAEKKKIAAMREVEEECGISNLYIASKYPKTYHTYSFKGKKVLKITYWYRMSYDGDENLIPQTEEGIEVVKWVSKSEIEIVLKRTYENLIPLFEKVLLDLKTFD